MTNILDVMVPRVHLNGTSKNELLHNYADAVAALRTAEKKIAFAWPHARDYYVQGDGAAGDAMIQHQARMRKLQEVLSELEAICEGIMDQETNTNRGWRR